MQVQDVTSLVYDGSDKPSAWTQESLTSHFDWMPHVSVEGEGASGNRLDSAISRLVERENCEETETDVD